MAVAKQTIAQPKTGGTRIQVVPLLLIAGAIAVIGLLRVVQTSQATTASFAIQSLQQEQLERETTVRQLEAEIASLSSLERIERDAQRLGLTRPDETYHVTVNAAWPVTAEDVLPARFAPAGEEDSAGGESGATGSPESSGWWQDFLELLPFR